ncbi:DUF1294 domain-containing protein [Acetobacterium paludosum]|uniref:DUF1294 domain-containing protein n=1 Tax=Acetobacterium paludosum TaxID=52693 RepID=A0A923HU16_9FIRM|nr:DUF1294 domain-containing protein [Acetobacterium paludosum]MBC3888316.1 DUF1294 domain-containing protein [Acetobacterium paludosum]
MKNFILYLILYLIIINFVTFFLFWKDKRRSKRDAWRIPEKTLLIFSVVGGSVGGIMGMKVFHHKTKHLQFSLGLPVILLFQVGIAAVAFFKFG